MKPELQCEFGEGKECLIYHSNWPPYWWLQ